MGGVKLLDHIGSVYAEHRIVGKACSMRDSFCDASLAQPGTTEASAEALLVRQTPSTVEYLSPQADGTAPLKRSLALDTTDLAAAYAIAGGVPDSDLNEDFINDHPPPMVSGVVQDPGLQMFEKPDWARRGQQNA